MHDDEFIDSLTTDAYASWVLALFRFPAILKLKFNAYTDQFKLFATYKGKRYRVTGASRLGDVWLAEDFTRDIGYDLRVPIDECIEWGPKP